MEHLIFPSIGHTARKERERRRPERPRACNGLPHRGRSFLGNTRRTYPDKRSRHRMPCFHSLPLGKKRPVKDRGQPVTAKFSVTHLHLHERGRTNRSLAVLFTAVGNITRKPYAAKRLNKTAGFLAYFSEQLLEKCVYRIETTYMDDDKKCQNASNRHIVPAFAGLCLKWVPIRKFTHTQPHSRPMACQNTSSAS